MTPHDRLVGLRGDRARTLGHLGGGLLRRGHDEDLRGRQQLGHRDRDVAGAGRQVHEEDVEVAPVDVGQELLQRPVEHRPAPHDGGVALGEHADGDDLHAVGVGRHDHLLDLGGTAGDAEHAGHRVAVDVGVDHADLAALGRHRRGEVDRHRGLADAALAARHRVDTGQRGRLGERDLLGRLTAPELLLEGLALFFAHHVEVDLHPGDTRDLGDGGGDVTRDRVAQGTAA